MKSLIFAIVVMIMSSLTAFTQQPLGPSCEGTTPVGVQVSVIGSNNPVEVQIFSAAALNMFMKTAEKGYCYVPAAGINERRMVIQITMRILEHNRTTDRLKPQLIRAGVNIAVDEVSRRLPSRVRTQVRRTTRKYTYEPRIQIAQLQISSVVTIYAGKEVTWQKQATRYFSVEEKYFGGYSPREYRITGGGSTGELITFDQVIDLPETDKFSSDKRLEQLLKLMVTASAFKAETLPGQQQVLVMNATGGAKQ